MQWKDVSSFAQGQKDRTPNFWQAKIGPHFRAAIHHHIHYAPDEWLLSCEPFYSKHLLASKAIDGAKIEAADLVRAKFEEVAKALAAG